MVGVDLCLRHNETIAFVMPYVPHDRFHDYFDKLNAREVQDYMRNLLIALRHVHSFGVIHRDVKPSNFLHDRKSKKYLLVDFGLAQNLERDVISTKESLETVAAIEGGDGGNGDKSSATTVNDEEHQPQQVAEEQQQRDDDQSMIDEKMVVDDEPSTIGAQKATASDQSTMAGNINNNNTTNNTNNIKNKRKAIEFEETENVSTSKRMRLNGIVQTSTPSNTDGVQQASQQGPVSAQRASPFNIPSPFKSPLKQVNEISTPKKAAGFANDSPLTRHIKSAVLGYSIHSKLIAQHQTDGASSGRGAIAVAMPTMNNKLPSPAVLAPVAASPQQEQTQQQQQQQQQPQQSAHKYTVDNRRRGSSGGAALNNNNNKCYCYGKPTVCNMCIVKKEIHAPRAGTPGYRPSEVLLKYPNQTTAVDVWAAGVILISILSGCYPFFKGSDDFQALAEIITVFGDDVVRKTALLLGRHVSIGRRKKPLHLRKLCIRLRNRCKLQNNTPFTDSTKPMNCDNCEQMIVDCLCQHSEHNNDFSNDPYPDSVYDLLAKLMTINPMQRISASDALEHPFFKEEL